MPKNNSCLYCGEKLPVGEGRFCSRSCSSFHRSESALMRDEMDESFIFEGITHLDGKLTTSEKGVS